VGERRRKTRVERVERGAQIGDQGGGVGQWPMWWSIGYLIGTFAVARYVEKSTRAAKLCKKGAIGGVTNRRNGGQNATINHED